MKLRAKHLPAVVLGTAVLVIANPELLALLLTVQALGLELTMLLVALQFRSIRHSPLVVLGVALIRSLAAQSLSLATKLGAATIRALFPRACLRLAFLLPAFRTSRLCMSASRTLRVPF